MFSTMSYKDAMPTVPFRPVNMKPVPVGLPDQIFIDWEHFEVYESSIVNLPPLSKNGLFSRKNGQWIQPDTALPITSKVLIDADVKKMAKQERVIYFMKKVFSHFICIL
jgi:hypothetical protein